MLAADVESVSRASFLYSCKPSPPVHRSLITKAAISAMSNITDGITIPDSGHGGEQIMGVEFYNTHFSAVMPATAPAESPISGFFTNVCPALRHEANELVLNGWIRHQKL